MKNLFNKFSLTILSLLLLTSAYAQEQETFNFSLNEAIDYAFDHHPEILNAVADEERAMAQRNEVRGIGLPQINASFDLNNYINLPTSLIPAQFLDPNAQEGEFVAVQFGTQYNATAAVQANQLLFSGDYIVALQSSGTYIELSKKNTIKTKTDLALSVAKAYYGVLINQEQIKLVNANLERLRKLRDETQAMFDAGFVEKIDLDRLKVSYNNLEVQQTNLSKLIALGYANLKFQIGMRLDAPLSLTDTLDESIVADLVPDKNGFTYSDRIEYEMLMTQQKLANQSLKLEKVGYLPSISLFMNVSNQAQGNELFGENMRWFPIGLVGASVNLPIFDGLQRKFRIQQRKVDLMKLDNTIRNTQRGIDLELESSLVSLENSLKAMESQKENRELARYVSETSSKKYALGTGSSMEVVEAEASLKEAETNYYNALYEAIVAKLNYEKAKGTLIK